MAEFKIGSLRYTWRGQWTTGTTYNRDAVAQYEGKTFICLEPHTAGDFYDDLNHITQSGASTPYWELMVDGRAWKQAWTPDTYYSIGNIVTYGGIVYICTTHHISGSTVIDLSNWTTYSRFDNWNSAWTTSHNYGIGDVVKYGGIVYRCLTNHTSASSSTAGLEADQAKWEIVNNGYEYRQQYTSGTRYRVNDLVKLDANLYVCTAGHTGPSSFDPTKWTMYMPGLEYNNTWSSLTAYQINDVVIYGGYSYSSLTVNNTGNIPSSDSLNWRVVTQGYEFLGDWNSGASYKLGDVVRHGGQLFEAVVDNSNQNPTGFSVNATYTASGSSGTTLKVNSTVGVVPNMNVIGSGFSLVQRVLAVVDSTTITLDKAPDGTLVDGQQIVFVGVNYVYWSLLANGKAWKNRWQSASQYLIGDLVVWQNITYTCLQNHTASSLTRPDLDTNNTYWAPYLYHARKNASNTLGDIEIYNNGQYSVTPIGPTDYVLQSLSNVPIWKNINIVPEVYYVSTSNGVDDPAYGISWDRPWKTIAYACNFVGAGTQNPNTVALLRANKNWLVTEMYQWMLYQMSNNNPPFSSSSVFDQTKTIRDAELLIDAVIYDLSRGGNSQTVAATLAYFDYETRSQYFNAATAAAMPYIIASLTELTTLMGTAVNNIAALQSYQVLNSVNPSAIVEQTILSNSGEAGSTTLISALMGIVITALTNESTTAVPSPNAGLTATINVKTGTYAETLPITIPENVALVGDELRGVVVTPKVVIETTVTKTDSSTNLFTVLSTEGLYDGCPVQFLYTTILGVNATLGNVLNGTTYYVIGSTITDTQFSVSQTLGGDPVALTDSTRNTSMPMIGGDAIKDMFYMRDATGLRNMTLSGLLGTLSDLNINITRRPTGGAFTSLDPGSGPSDTSTWIMRRSPYVQNVTTFGVGCTGMKIDGTLHNGGNRSMVANDYTQIISDGIGVWCTGPNSLTECVSVFAYYCYSGYFAEGGGRIRATNGNSSYGTYGVVAEGYDVTENPITGTVFNQSKQVQASVESSFGTSAQLLRLNYSNAGAGYEQSTTNMLKYSNNFQSSWTTDGNVSIAKNLTAPSGLVEAWTFTGNTTGIDGSYIYQNVAVQPAGSTFTNVPAINITGAGIAATFDVTVTSTGYTVVVNSGGSGYVNGNQMYISGAQLGGQASVNDCIITVTGLSGSSILTVTATGVVPTGSAQNYTLSIYAKKGSAPSIDLFGIFSGSSTVSSSINFNFNTGVITPSRTNGGFLPTQYGKVVLPDGWYRVWFALNDTTGLNSQLQFRIYPRGYNGNTGQYTSFYGSQMEISSSDYEPSFYLETTTNMFTAYANFNITGAGTGAVAVGDEIRSQAVFQTRVMEGGSGYMTGSNNAQSGTPSYIQLAQSEVATATTYTGMRVFINSGTGAGQYGFISSYDPTSKIAYVLRETIDTIGISATTSGSNVLSVSSGDIRSMYVNEPIQFIPTYYTTAINSTSIASVLVTGATGGTVNTLTVASTLGLAINQPVTFSGTMISTLTAGFTYYIYSIIDDTTIQITNELFGNVWQLTNGVGSLSMNYPANNGYINANTSNMAVNLPIEFTGTSAGGIVVGSVYYINDVIDSNTFTISGSLVNVAATATNSSSNAVTVDSTSSLVLMNPIVFSGTSFGNLVEGTKYYISKVIDSTSFTIVSSLTTTTASATAATTNLITVGSTSGFVPNNPIKFVGTAFGNIISETVYYILAVNDSTTFTISQTPGGSAVGLATATGKMIVQTAPAAFTLTTATGTMTGTSTSTKTALTFGYGSMNGTFSTVLFGGVSSGTTYYIKTIDTNNNQLTISATQGGAALALATKTGAMNIGAVGWDHVNIGTPAVANLDSTSLYFIEPRTTYSAPPFSQTTSTAVALPVGTNWTSMAYGNGMYMAFPSGGSTASSTTDGATWNTVVLPSSQSWTDVAYGNNYWVGISSGGLSNSVAIYSNSNGLGWKSTTLPSSTTWSSVTYGNGKFVAIASGGTSAAYSSDFGKTWNSATLPASSTWIQVVYGNGIFLAISSSGTGAAAISTNGTTWTSASMPANAWNSVAYGNGRFVATCGTGASAVYSFNGTTWYSSNISITADTIVYGQGVFLALSSTNSTAYTSTGGLDWKFRTVTNDGYTAAAYGLNGSTNNGMFLTLAGRNVGSNISAGATARGRPAISSGIITSVSQWESGSGYTSVPTVTFTDPNVTKLATVTPRLNNGTLGNPSWLSRGSGYNTSSTSVIVTGNGYSDQFQTGLTLTINNLTKLPQPGDNLTIDGNTQIYKVTSATAVYGTVAPNIQANVQIAPDMSVALSPENGAAVTIREKYSQARLTGHDFLDVGFGNQLQSNYPNLPPETTLSPQNQTVEINYGRVFYTSTDQDGNFKVGSLFGVQQATGIVTLSASQFGLTGLQTLSLGGIAVGGSSVVVNQFSTDGAFVANSDNIIPTQKAIKTYLTSRLSQGGANTFTGQLVAGTTLVGGPNKIGSTISAGIPGSNVTMKNKIMITGAQAAVDGNAMAYAYFAKTWNHR